MRKFIRQTIVLVSLLLTSVVVTADSSNIVIAPIGTKHYQAQNGSTDTLIYQFTLNNRLKAPLYIKGLSFAAPSGTGQARGRQTT